MLPFFIDKLFQTDLEGTAILQTAGLKLVFHTPEEGQHFFDADVNELLVTWAELEALDVRRGMLSHALLLVLKSDANFPKELKPKDNRLELSVRRGDKEKLDEFEKDLASLRAGKALDDTDEFIDDMRDFLDRM